MGRKQGGTPTPTGYREGVVVVGGEAACIAVGMNGRLGGTGWVAKELYARGKHLVVQKNVLAQYIQSNERVNRVQQTSGVQGNE